MTAQLGEAGEVHQANPINIRDACKLVAKRVECILPRSKDEDERYKLAVTRLDDALAQQTAEKPQLQTQIDRSVGIDAGDVAEFGPKIASDEGIVTDATNAFRWAAESNQIYRLAASFYRVGVNKVTDAQFATARWVFSIFSAVAVAFAGGIAALVYYAPIRAPGRPSTIAKLWLKSVNRRRSVITVYRDGKEQVQVPGPTGYVPVSVPVPGVWTHLFERWFGHRDTRQEEAAA